MPISIGIGISTGAELPEHHEATARNFPRDLDIPDIFALN